MCELFPSIRIIPFFFNNSKVAKTTSKFFSPNSFLRVEIYLILGDFPSTLKYFPNKSSFAIKTVKFKPKEGATIIQASKKEDKYVFYSSYGETYEWVVDLKEMQAQRILNSYCAQLSRVGLNESEWLRLIAKQ